MNGFEQPFVDHFAASQRAQRWATFGVVALLLASVAAPLALHAWVQSRKSAIATPPPPPLKPSPADEFRGITLKLHSYWDKIPFEEYVEEIARTGANTICFALAALQENCASSSLFVEYRKVPTTKRLASLIKLAHGRGLRVVIMPIVLLEDPGTDEWRGKNDPTDMEAWWSDYESYILHYARIAQDNGVEMFLVGSELVSMEGPEHTARWRALIAKVREAYKGLLSYSANWDHYDEIEWWGDLDVVGMTSYHDLVGDNQPTLEVLRASWEPIKKEVLTWQRKINRPILFTEVGWPSQVGCAKEPWNYYGSDTADLETQAKCFQAFFDTWRGEPGVGGVLIWEWRNHPPAPTDEVPEERSYVPRGKPAMKIIREYFKSGAARDDDGARPTTRKSLETLVEETLSQ